MFNKSQRTILNALSLEVYGTESQWTKLLNDPKYQIVTGTKETSGQKYVQYQSKGKPGTVVTLEKAISKFGFQPTEEQMSSPVVATESRPATFDELFQALTTAAEVALHSALTPEERQHVFADMLANGKLPYKLILEIGESEATKEAFEAQLALLSEDKSLLIKDMLRKDDKQKGIAVDAYGFVSDVVFCTNHKAKAAELSVSYIADAKARSAGRKMVDKNLQSKLHNEAVNKRKRQLNQKLKESGGVKKAKLV